MKLTIDTDAGTLTVENGGSGGAIPLYSPEAFRLVSEQWLKIGWTQKYSYGFTWLGRPIVQLPEDLIRIQELIWQLQPDVIVETGVAHGGSLIFYAALCKTIGRGRVIGVDIEIRSHNRREIERHALGSYITLVEGDSTSPEVVQQVEQLIPAGARVLVILDSCHTQAHVRGELEAYAPLVTPGSYVVVTDGVMQDLAGLPNVPAEWSWDNPQQAAFDFLAGRNDFQLQEPETPFNEGSVRERITYWPSAWLRRCA